MGILNMVGRSVDELVKLGYPESVAKRISSGELPMDEASRLARAKSMGFDVETPWYHGTNADIDSFIPSNSGVFGPGVYTTKNPNQAEKYGYSIYPIGIKKEKPISSGIMSKEDAKKISDALGGFIVDDYKSPYDNWINIKREFGADKATEVFKKAGYDSLRHKSYLIPFNPSNIRSKYAAFDPLESGSSNLLASHPTATIGAGVLGLTQSEAAQNNLDALMSQYNNLVGRNESIYNYGELLPIKRSVVTGDYSPAIPKFVDDIARGLLDLGQSRKSGVVNNSSSILDVLF